MRSMKGQKVLVTGADGFIASHVCEILIENKAKVTGLVKRNSSGLLKNLNSITKKMKIEANVI